MKKKNALNITVTDKDVAKKNPCYLHKYLPEGWSKTLLEIAELKEVPASDRIWLITAFLPDRENRMFAIWNARQAQVVAKLKTNEKYNDIMSVVERYANGNATEDERASAWESAWESAWASARGSARASQIKYLKDILNMIAVAKDSIWGSLEQKEWYAKDEMFRTRPLRCERCKNAERVIAINENGKETK